MGVILSRTVYCYQGETAHMVAYTLHWECPYCEESNTQLNHRAISDTPSKFSKRTLRNDARSGLEAHIRISQDATHGGCRGEFPDDWSEELADDCIDVSEGLTVDTEPSAPSRKPGI